MKNKGFLLFVFSILLASTQAFAGNTEALCRFAKLYAPVKGADYVPGVDVHGNNVVPADINAAASTLPDIIRLPMTVDMATGLSMVLPTGTKLEAETGMIEIHRNGSVVYNGHDLSAATSVMCGTAAPTPEPAAPVPMTKETQQVKPAEPEPAAPQKSYAPPAEDVIIWGEYN